MLMKVISVIRIKHCTFSELQYPKMFFRDATSVTLCTFDSEVSLGVTSSNVFQARCGSDVRQFRINKQNKRVLTNGESAEAVRAFYTVCCHHRWYKRVEKCAGLLIP